MRFTSRYVDIFGFSVYYYALIIAAGAMLAVAAASRREKALGLEKDTALDIALVALPFGLIGARAYYVLLHPDEFGSFSEVLDLRGGGLGIYGGILLGALAAFILCRIKKGSFLRWADLALPCVALAQGIGRWGNFINQEAYGIEVSPALRFFPAAVYIPQDGLWHAAAFFYESVWCVLIFLIACALPSKQRFIKKGAGTLFYLLMYGFERAMVEGLRTDSLYLGPVRASQLVSVLALSAAALILLKNASRPLYMLILCASGAVLSVLSALTLLPQLWLYCSAPTVFIFGIRGFIRLYCSKRPDQQQNIPNLPQQM